MLTVTEALSIIRRFAQPLPPLTLPLTPAVLGLVLAEDIASDLDIPPFHKTVMDGYAIRASDFSENQDVFTIVEQVLAGQTPKLPLGPGQTTRVMTGAPLPAGADTVVMMENTHLVDEHHIQVKGIRPRPCQHVLNQGREARRGETILAKGTHLRPPELGLLATVGRTHVKVFPQPRVAILATGDELVEAQEVPGPGQIRNSNGPMLCGLVSRAGGLPQYLGIAQDSLANLHPLVAEGFHADVLVLSGGVSVGDADLVPQVLQEAGVQTQLHKVALKPGKPIFFGTRDNTLVFGLPGNPVSNLVCFEVFVRPALRLLAGWTDPGPFFRQGVLAVDFDYQADRDTFHPAHLEIGGETNRVQPIPWFGSSDLRSLARTNALVLFPKGKQRHRMGQVYSVLPLDW
jgi:molybdopterin molybdotransferase